jgi:predicted SAM-dependent methyltransferase
VPIVDKHSVLATLPQRTGVRLELGCGGTKRDASAIGIDAQDLPGVDLVGDVFDALAAFPVASVDEVSSFHFFEHVEDLPGLLEAVARVVKPGGHVRVVTPHFSNPYFHSDYTHRRSFGLYTLCYLARSALFARQVPTYGAALLFEVEDVRLGFKSTRPFYVRHAIKRTQGAVFNATRWLQEYWEENLCWSFPAYEVDYRLRRL